MTQIVLVLQIFDSNKKHCIAKAPSEYKQNEPLKLADKKRERERARDREATAFDVEQKEMENVQVHT